MPAVETAKLHLQRTELFGLQFTWKNYRSPGLLQTARALKQWQTEKGSPQAVCTFSVKDDLEYANPFQTADVHENPGEVDWTNTTGSLHTHNKTGAEGRAQVMQDLQSLVFSNETFQGVIDPEDKIYLFVKHLFYQGFERFVHNLRTVTPRSEMALAEAWVTTPGGFLARNFGGGGFSNWDHQRYLKEVTADTGVIFFMGSLKNDKLTYYGQYNY